MGAFFLKGIARVFAIAGMHPFWRPLTVPHATLENKLAEAYLSDLLTGPLKGKNLKMQRVDAFTEQSEVDGRAKRTVKLGEKSTIELGGE
ncbi:MAG: hypothetical protein AB3N28_03120 [Kordiimonas sp.]